MELEYLPLEQAELEIVSIDGVEFGVEQYGMHAVIECPFKSCRRN